jgi:hypothetical protein
MGQSISIPAVGGIPYDSFLDYTKSIEIPTQVVDVKGTFDRYKDRDSNLISPETVLNLQLKTDVFLAHDWGIDEFGRVNHERVAAINKELKSMGIVTWFDSDKMTGEIVYQMASGIDNAAVVIVFITQRYMNKVNGSNANDNCRKGIQLYDSKEIRDENDSSGHGTTDEGYSRELDRGVAIGTW